MNEAKPSADMAVAPCRRRYPDDFKRDAVRLVTEEKYSFKVAAEAVGVSEKSLRDWYAKLVPPPAPCGDDATVAAREQAAPQATQTGRDGTWNLKKSHGVLCEGFL